MYTVEPPATDILTAIVIVAATFIGIAPVNVILPLPLLFLCSYGVSKRIKLECGCVDISGSTSWGQHFSPTRHSVYIVACSHSGWFEGGLVRIRQGSGNT